MIEQLLTQFTGSSDAAGLLAELQGKGLSATQAKDALGATAEGAAQAAASQGLGGLMGMLGGGGGGGIGGALGSMLGGGAPSVGGLPPAMIEQVARSVAQKVGLDPSTANMVVGLALPKILAFVKERSGGAAGGLGKLFG